MSTVPFAVWFLLMMTARGRADIYEDLITRGVPLGGGQVVRLPKPLMADGLTAKEQQAVLAKAADKYPLDRFVRNSVVSPYVLDVNAVGDAGGGRRGQQIDFHFVAYGTLDAVTDSELLTSLAGESEGAGPDAPPPSARTLTDEELKARGLPPNGASQTDPNYIAIDVPILERVRLYGIAQGYQKKTDASVLGSIRLDEHFAKDPKYPNSWRPMRRDALGKNTLGQPTPYSGLGGYMKVTKLIEPAGAVFIECHLVFDEPQGWFDGKNLLRSKLPLIVQDSVRKFRRKLGAASQ
ncbi:MAG TPA: hypothetical protein VGJ26_21475 [Pirellulales bacterium]|jgi:hypothetical protein